MYLKKPKKLICVTKEYQFHIAKLIQYNYICTTTTHNTTK